MNLREWSTNSVFVNNIIQSEDKSSMSTIKVLGHYWNTNQDTLSLKEPSLMNSLVSERAILKDLTSVFEPLGFVSP
ncbi:hypothetical protein DPMN_075696 [Dreissena polymorpha]|uniref:Uncharacterized protein n=1 Tax=Dreissena polymorpha TaxID=45954 RepID=A0A9D3YHB5_DREPO|nr:hypothetical protein DPMN_075696 [Dreissena polymorpha]